MSRTLRAMMVVLFLSHPAAGGFIASPRNLDDACSIVKQRPKYMKAFRATERKWGVPVHVQMATIYQESRFRRRRPHAVSLCAWRDPDGPPDRAPMAIGRRWTAPGIEYRADTGRARCASATKIDDATDFMGWYMNQQPGTERHRR